MSRTPPPNPHVTEVKDLFGGETKVVDKRDGVVEAVVSVTGIKDEVDDIIKPGAYAKTLATRKPKGIRSHDWNRPAMKTLAIDELHPGDPGLPARTSRGERWPRSAGATKVLMQFNLDTKDGREGFSNVNFYGPEQEWSIGYNVPRNQARMVKGIREIEALDLYEYSDVLFGAMPLAGTQAIKAYGGIVVTGGLWTPPRHEPPRPGSLEQRKELVADAVDAAYRDEYGEDARIAVAATFHTKVLVAVLVGEDREEYLHDYDVKDGVVELGEKRKFTQAERERAPHQPGTEGSFPIANVDDLDNAIRAVGRAKDPAAAKRWIIRRARELNAVSHLPASWNVEKAEPEPAETKDLGEEPLTLEEVDELDELWEFVR